MPIQIPSPRYIFNFIFAICITFSVFSPAKILYSTDCLENERTACTLTDEDFQLLVLQRKEGLAGFHQNVDLTQVIPAPETAVLNWAALPSSEKERLIVLQEEMFRQGKITLIVMAGGEATRFGGPKTFVRVSEDLGEFLEIKEANLNWMRTAYGAKVPLFILSSEKRLPEFKAALAERNYYGLDPRDFRWYVQGTVDTFIPSDEELKAHFSGQELDKSLKYAKNSRQLNPDGIYRFNGERRKVPAGHFDAIASFIISGLLSEALAQGIEFAPIVNIDNLLALLKNDGMIAHFAEQGNDFGFLLAEKNLAYTIHDKRTGRELIQKLIVRFRDGVISFDGISEFSNEAEWNGYRFTINQESKTIDIYHAVSGEKIEAEMQVKTETGGTLVQAINEAGDLIGEPMIKECFELNHHFNHANAPFFNTNTIIVNLKCLLKFIGATEEQLASMTFEERSILVREKLIKQIKTYFEFKNHEVEGEYPDLGVVKGGKTKIPVSQATRIMLQAAHLKGTKTGYLFAPRSCVLAPVKEPEDKKPTAEKYGEVIKRYTLKSPLCH